MKPGVARYGRTTEGKRYEITEGNVVLGIPTDGKYEGSRATLAPLVQSIASHEIGPALGVALSDSARDVMYPFVSRDPSKSEVSARDYKTVDALYELPNDAWLK